MISGDVIERLCKARASAKYDDAVVVAYEPGPIGSPPTYRAVLRVSYNDVLNAIYIEIGRESVPLAALKEGWRPDA